MNRLAPVHWGALPCPERGGRFGLGWERKEEARHTSALHTVHTTLSQDTVDYAKTLNPQPFAFHGRAHAQGPGGSWHPGAEAPGLGFQA